MEVKSTCHHQVIRVLKVLTQQKYFVKNKRTEFLSYHSTDNLYNKHNHQGYIPLSLQVVVNNMMTTINVMKIVRLTQCCLSLPSKPVKAS